MPGRSSLSLVWLRHIGCRSWNATGICHQGVTFRVYLDLPCPGAKVEKNGVNFHDRGYLMPWQNAGTPIQALGLVKRTGERGSMLEPPPDPQTRRLFSIMFRWISMERA